MTYKQFKRWEDFSVRMAKNCYPKTTEAREKKILEEVEDYFKWRRFQKDYPEINDWDGNGDNYCLCDQVDEFFDEYIHWNRREGFYTGKLYNQITCCIRAGFDMAVKPSAGVVGFTAGDLRRMWQGKVPKWITGLDWNVPFNSIGDSEPVWL